MHLTISKFLMSNYGAMSVARDLSFVFPLQLRAQDYPERSETLQSIFEKGIFSANFGVRCVSAINAFDDLKTSDKYSTGNACGPGSPLQFRLPACPRASGFPLRSLLHFV
jgi:hypothetical protein